MGFAKEQVLAAHHTHRAKGAAVKNILVLFDSISIRKEVAKYAVELAKRTDCELIILMLLTAEMNDRDSEDSESSENKAQLQIQDAFALQAEHMESAGVSVRAIVRTGDPQSELMKFLAGSSTTRTIVWGGSPDLLMDQKAHNKKAHWLVRAKGLVECPLVVPSMKA